MAKLTPIERAIAGEPTDRRRRYDKRLADRGFVRVTYTCRPEVVPLLKRALSALNGAAEDLPDDQFGELVQAVDDILSDATPTHYELPAERTDRPQRKRGRTARSSGTGAADDAL